MSHLTFIKWFWIVFAIMFIPVLIIGYGASIYKAIKDRKLIAQKIEQRLLKKKRRSSSVGKGVLRKQSLGNQSQNSTLTITSPSLVSKDRALPMKGEFTKHTYVTVPTENSPSSSSDDADLNYIARAFRSFKRLSITQEQDKAGDKRRDSESRNKQSNIHSVKQRSNVPAKIRYTLPGIATEVGMRSDHRTCTEFLVGEQSSFPRGSENLDTVRPRVSPLPATNEPQIRTLNQMINKSNV